jgi:hypothetical protein
MSSVLDRLFDNTANLGNDVCDMTNRNKQNVEAANYMLENYTTENPASSALNLAMNQPNISMQASPQGGINGDNVDVNSVLVFGNGSAERGRGIHQERLFNTIPYLGKGPANTPLESQILMGVNNPNKKSQDPTSEVSHLNLAYTPLIPSIESTVTNPANFVEGVAADGWIRGGVPSRLLNREED